MTVTVAAPYPPDTRAKGWRFELDLERVRQSDTWALAAAEVRPWLLMLWATAWEQTLVISQVREMLYNRARGYRKHLNAVIDRDGYTCRYCGCENLLTLDHVEPRSRGGSDEPSNLALACKPCNSSKGARTPQEWRA